MNKFYRLNLFLPYFDNNFNLVFKPITKYNDSLIFLQYGFYEIDFLLN